MINDVSKVVSNLYIKQKDFFASQITKPNAYRIQKLKALRKEIIIRELEIHEALNQDMRKSAFEAMTSETVLVNKELSLMIKMLPLWSRVRRAKSSLINFH